MKTYFITGATGSIGSAIVPLLLADSDTRVRLLIRAQDKSHLDERMQKLCAFWDRNPADLRERVQAIQGDMGLERFGMEPDTYASLEEECTHIIHCGGVVRMNLPLEDARKAALVSAQNIIALAEECNRRGLLRKVEFISTVGVAGHLAGLVPEALITQPRSFHNTYEQAKAEAETFISRKLTDGLPITVHRPSMVVGDSQTGKIIHFQVFSHLCEFLSGRRTNGFVPRLQDVQLDTVPVDYVAAAIVRSSSLPEWRGKILHHCSGPDLAVDIPYLRQLVEQTFKKHNREIPPATVVPYSLFKRSIPLLKPFVPEMTKRALNALPFFFVYLEEKQSFANAETQKLLSAEAIDLPRPAQYLETVLTYYLEHNA